MDDSVGDTFVAFVGEQPAVVLVAWRAWVRMRDGRQPDRTLVFHTQRTEASAGRLVRHVPGSELRPIPPAGGPDPSARWIETTAADVARAGAVTLLVMGGRKSATVVPMARALRHSGAAVTTLLSDDATLAAVSPVRQARFARIEDLGWATLLDLHDLECSPCAAHPALDELLARGDVESLPPGAQRGVALRCRSSDLPPSLHDVAFERRGQLHSLRVIRAEVGSCEFSSDDERRSAESRAALKEYRGMFQADLGGLQPHRAVVVDAARFYGVHRRASEDERIVAIDLHLRRRHDARRLRDWLAAGVRTATPGSPRRGALPPPTNGKGGGGAPLAVILGPRPASTLLAIETHAPGRAFVFVDTESPASLAAARRLREVACDISVGELRFQPTDRFGRGLDDQLGLLVAEHPDLRVNVTPGTKAQAFSLESAGVGQLWALDGPTREARPVLRAADDTERRPVRSPGVRAWATICGGHLKHGGCWRLSDLTRADIEALGRLRTALLDRAARASGSQGGRARPLAFLGGRLAGDVGAGLSARESYRRLELEWGGRRHILSLPGGRGDWLDPLAALCFADAGADDVAVQVQWSWSAGERADAHMRDEIDVVCRFEERWVAVSCKAGKRDAEPAGQWREREMHRTVTVATLGTFCLPLVVIPSATPGECERSLGSDLPAYLVNMEILGDPTRLRRWVERAFEVLKDSRARPRGD
jgi:hypothetical protein